MMIIMMVTIALYTDAIIIVIIIITIVSYTDDDVDDGCIVDASAIYDAANFVTNQLRECTHPPWMCYMLFL